VRYDDVPAGSVRIAFYGGSLGDANPWLEPDPESPYDGASRRCTVVAGSETAFEVAVPPVKSKDSKFATLELHARVTEAATGRPLEHATVSVELQQGDTTLDLLSVETDEEGRAARKLFAAERYTVNVYGPWSSDASAPSYQWRTFELTPKNGVLEVDVVLEPKPKTAK
jgi:hypothetical protein